jgi:hypothetical protein
MPPIDHSMGLGILGSRRDARRECELSELETNSLRGMHIWSAGIGQKN